MSFAKSSVIIFQDLCMRQFDFKESIFLQKTPNFLAY